MNCGTIKCSNGCRTSAVARNCSIPRYCSTADHPLSGGQIPRRQGRCTFFSQVTRPHRRRKSRERSRGRRGRCRFHLPPQWLAARRRPILHLLVALGVAIIGSFEIAEGDNEPGPAVDEAKLEDIMLEERPRCVPKRARHCHSLVRELRYAQRGIAVGLAQNFFKITEGKLPDRIAQCAERLLA